jgi:hypothetical protein
MKLEQLRELDAHLDVVKMDKNAAIKTVLTDEIKAQLADLDIEFDGISKSIRDTAAVLEAEIKSLVLKEGASTKGGGYRAIYVKGSRLWDTKALDGYAAAHSEIDQFRKVGDPSVRINKKAKSR